MSDEYFALKKLLMRRDELEQEAAMLRSPGFEEHYSSGHKSEAGFEDQIIEAADMDEKIEKAFLAFVKRVERENKEILTKSSGQRQRILRLHFIVHKRLDEIADLMSVDIRTVINRLENKDNGARDSPVYPLADALTEEHIVWMYETLQGEIGERYLEVEALIEGHRALAASHRKKYDSWLKKVRKTISTLTGKDREIVERRLCNHEKWRDIARAVGYSERWTRKRFNSAFSC